MKACGLTSLPDRRTFDRRLSTISADIKDRIATMASLFVKENLVDPYIIAIDSTVFRAKGDLWHKSSIIKGLVPSSGIDTDARWGFSHLSRQWIFGYKLHITSSPGSLIIPLSADFTQADVQDNQRYPAITIIYYLLKNGAPGNFSLFFRKLAFYFNQKVYPKIHL